MNSLDALGALVAGLQTAPQVPESEVLQFEDSAGAEH
jgi:hypothetical protein